MIDPCPKSPSVLTTPGLVCFGRLFLVVVMGLTTVRRVRCRMPSATCGHMVAYGKAFVGAMVMTNLNRRWK